MECIVYGCQQRIGVATKILFRHLNNSSPILKPNLSHYTFTTAMNDIRKGNNGMMKKLKPKLHSNIFSLQ